MSARRCMVILLCCLLQGFLLPGHAAEFYVDLNSSAPTPPYNSWATAATNIQDAVDLAPAGSTVLVAPGIYGPPGQEGWDQIRAPDGVLSTLIVTNEIMVQSSPPGALIEGDFTPSYWGGIRGVYMDKGTLSGFEISGGYLRDSDGAGVFMASVDAVVSNCLLRVNRTVYGVGGGSYGGTLRNCWIEENQAVSGGGCYESRLEYCTVEDNVAAGEGGGTYGGSLLNCEVIGNETYPGQTGGGCYGGTLRNCALIENSAYYGGGCAYATLYNCTVMENEVTVEGGGCISSTAYNSIVVLNTSSRGTGHNWLSSTFFYSCAWPLPAGEGNISVWPDFTYDWYWYINRSSPCVSAGSAEYASGTDLQGEAWANPPSMGCDEPWSAYDYWALERGLDPRRSGGSPVTDWRPTGNIDGDRMNNEAEFIAGTNPTNSLSEFVVDLNISPLELPVVGWNSVSGRVYEVHWSPSPTNAYQLLQGNLRYPANCYTGSVHALEGAGTYKVNVKLQD